jgi:MFS family permease
MYLGVLNYVAVYTTIRERPLYTAAIGIVWGTGTILGPVVGGAFVSVHIQTSPFGSELTHAGKQFCIMAVVSVPLASLSET